MYICSESELITIHTEIIILTKKFSTFIRKMVSSQSELQTMFFTCEKISLHNQNHNVQYIIILLSKSRQNGRQTYIIYFFIYFLCTEIYCNLIVNKTMPKI